MITCKVGENTINCFDGKYNKETLKKWSEKNILLCPVCNKPYEYCHGEFVSPYFRHKEKDKCEDYYSEPETEEHIKGKQTLYKWLKAQSNVTDVILEAWLPQTRQRPDLAFKINGKQFVIEYQCSPISSEYIKRHELYQAAGITDIWILGTEKYLNIKNKNICDKGRGKQIQQHTYLYLKGKSLIVNKSEIKKYLAHNLISLKDYIVVNIKDSFIQQDTLKICDKIINEYIEKDNQKYDKVESLRKLNCPAHENIFYLINTLNKEYGKNTFSFMVGKDYYRYAISYCQEIEMTFFVKNKKTDCCYRESEYSKYERLYEFAYDIFDENNLHEFIVECIDKRKVFLIEEESKKLQEQINILTKSKNIFGDFLNKEIILLNGKNSYSKDIRFKFLKDFCVSEYYLYNTFIKELKFLKSKDVNTFIFMIPKYHNYFNCFGFEKYIRVGELEDKIIEFFKKYGFTNIRFYEGGH